MVCDQLQIDKNKIIKIVEDRPGKDKSYLMDTNKARLTLNWEPQTNLQNGIRQTIVWLKNNLSHLKRLPKEYIHKL